MQREKSRTAAFSLLVSVSILFLGIPSAGKTTVFETDDRRPLNESEMARFGSGTGVIYCKNLDVRTLQGDDWTMTTATVVSSRSQLIGSGHWRASRRTWRVGQTRSENDEEWSFSPRDCVFRLYNLNGEKAFESHIASYELFDQVATFVLTSPVPKTVISHELVEIKSITPSELEDLNNLAVVAHHHDLKPRETMISEGCRGMLAGTGYPRFYHHCDITGGASGGRVFAVVDGKKQIIGINAAETPRVNLAYLIDEAVLDSLASKR